MKKRPERLAKCLSGITAAALILASTPEIHIHAEEGLDIVEEYAEEELDGEPDSVGSDSSVFIITDFQDFHKNEEGQFEKEEIQQKYGSIKAEPGTSLSQLPLPEKLVLTGYMENEGPDASTVYEMTDFDWISKPDTGEAYSESSPEGSYTFIPDLEAYAFTSDTIDEFKLADETVQLPEVSITIESQQETETPSQPEDPALTVDGSVPTDGSVTADGSVPTDDSVTADGSAPTDDSVTVDGSVPTDDSVTVDGSVPTDDSVTVDGSVPTDGEQDVSDDSIFDHLDDSALDTQDSGAVEVYDSSASPADTTETEDTANTDNASLAPADTAGTENTANTDDASLTPAGAASPDDTVNTDDASLTPAGTDGADDTVNTDDASVSPSGDTPASQAVTSVSASFTITDASGNLLYSHTDANGSNSFTLSTDTVPNEFPPVVLPCGTDLTGIKLNFANTDSSVTSSLTVSEGADFGAASVQDITLTETTATALQGTYTNNYTVRLNITKSEHQWTDATCTTPKTCSVCGATEGEAAGHQWTNATCTTPKTCSVCGATEGTALGHQWINATCTAPKTCSVCGATEGEAAGHQWKDATCTTPRTCSVCGATDGEALGHDWIEATCTEPRTCDRCGITEGSALGHDWIEATCTEPKTCDLCGATQGQALGHNMSDNWETIRQSTDSVHGEQARYCNRGCGYTETRALNIIADPANNAILDLAEGGQYNLNTRLTFTASGAGMGNTSPINGDVRYVPLSWNIQNIPGSFMDNFTGAFSITNAGTYTVTVTFQKQTFDGNWKATDIVDNKSVTFTVGNLVQGTPIDGTANGIKINPQTGDDTPVLPMVLILLAALAVLIGVVFYRKKQRNK